VFLLDPWNVGGEDIKKEIGIGWVGYAPGCKKQGIFGG